MAKVPAPKTTKKVGKSLKELRSRAGEQAFSRLMEHTPRRILLGETVES